jgi:hypothetical protein
LWDATIRAKASRRPAFDLGTEKQPPASGRMAQVGRKLTGIEIVLAEHESCAETKVIYTLASDITL